MNEFIDDYLGELTDETSSKIIGDFIGLGPKNYSFICENPKKSKTVIKGFTLKNYKDKLNHESLREMMIENVIKKNNHSIKTEEEAIQIKKVNDITRIENTVREKEYGFVYDKRNTDIKNQEHIDSLPYGY